MIAEMLEEQFSPDEFTLRWTSRRYAGLRPTRSCRDCHEGLAVSCVSIYYLDMIRFDWDERKNKSNRAKHGVWFEEAQSVFDDPHARVFYDQEHSEEEDRLILLGMSLTGRLLVVVHCYREADSLVRIISARKATKREARYYEERI
jgi:uncharacterized protein